MLFSYREPQSVRSQLLEKFLEVSDFKGARKSKIEVFKNRDFSKSYASPTPPAYLARKVELGGFTVAGGYVHSLSPLFTQPEGTIVFLHGGSYVLNATRLHWRFLADLVSRTGCRVLAPDYPLAPEASWGRAYRMLVPFCESIGAGEDYVLMGDSAGGGLALGMGMHLRDERVEPPAALVLLCPWLDVTLHNPEIVEIDEKDPFLNLASLRRAGRAWAGGTNPRKPAISPMYGSVEGLPPMSLFIGTKDLLAADCFKFRNKCAAQGFEIAYYEFENMLHDWMLLEFKEALLAREEIARIVRKALGLPPLGMSLG